jgi:glycosyltransferase involved in cell wall biosynthesis
MKRILCIGNRITYDLYKQGLVPSHWLYGVAELEDAGFDVVNCEYKGNAFFAMFADMYYVIKYRPDCIYIPFFNFRNHILLLLLIRLRGVRKPLITFIHRTPVLFAFSHFLMKSVSAAFFLSPKNREEAEQTKLLKREVCYDAFLGPDLSFYDEHRSSQKRDYFISTGKENRDYKLLINVFSNLQEQLMIYTCHSHAGNNYADLPELGKNLANIDVRLEENSGVLFREMLWMMSESKCIVCPLLKDKINYCVGLSSIADSMALGLPIIVTSNSYHPIDINQEGIGIAVSNVDEWFNAVGQLKNTAFTIEMGQKARKLAEEKYNIKLCAEQIITVLNKLQE